MARRIRSIRAGKGRGMGKGYKNLIPKDPKVHSESAMGRKQPQRIVGVPEPPKYTSEQQELIEMFDAETLRQAEKEAGSTITGFRKEQDGVAYIEFEDGSEYMIFDDYDTAEKFATDRVYDDLENEPEMFTQSWLENFITISDTDRRIIAQEESDNLVDNVYDDNDILDRAGQVNEYDAAEGDDEKQEKILDDAREYVREDEYDRIHDELSDPINYFIDEHGYYKREELLKQPFISIDIDNAAKDAVATDGWAHFIATYDGEERDLPNGKVMARTN